MFVVVLGGWVITLCLHEFAHALVAYVGGDSSVRARGYLTLNPARYTDLATSVVMPIILLAIGGIPLPGGAVLVEPGRLRFRWWASLVSAAGPAADTRLAYQRWRSRPGSTRTAPPGNGIPPTASKRIGMITL